MTITDFNLAGYSSLGADINKKKGEQFPETKEGIIGEKLPELELEMSDEDILKLIKSWDKSWKESKAKSEWEKQIEENEKYWLGKQTDNLEIDKVRPTVDNLIFESLEIFLPEATRRNPEPLVSLDNSEKNDIDEENPVFTKYVSKIKRVLFDLSDKNKIRLKLKKAVRHWAIFHIGIAKIGWDIDKDIPSVKIIRPKKIILDPEATIDEDGYSGEYIGEYRRMSAFKLIKILEADDKNTKSVALIKDEVKDDLGTIIGFEEWWTKEYMCWKLKDKIILKKKNPHWNYDTTENEKSVDNYGNETDNNQEKKGINHFYSPKMPYEFVSIFNLGDQPMDKTSLIQQNISNQNIINKRNRQIDKNVDDINGGWVISLARSSLTKPQAESVAKVIRKGGAAIIADGIPREAIDRIQPPSLPSDIYAQLTDMRTRLQDIFGTRGSSPAGNIKEKTVRGKIMNKGFDTDRIGGGITEYLEQFADNIFNWFLQMLYVYDSNFQFVEGAKPPKIVISVKEGSLLPKDSASIANQALDLARMNRISNLDLYKRLEWANPEEIAANVWLEQNSPQLLYRNNPLIQEALAMAKQSAEQNQIQEQQNKEQEHQKSLEMEQLKNNNKNKNAVQK